MKKIFTIAVLCLGALLVPNQASAQCRVIRSTPVYGPVYSPPVVVRKDVAVVKEVVKEVPIAVPVFVPAFQFQYQPPCYAAPCAHPAPVEVTPYGHTPQAPQAPGAYGNGPPMVAQPGQQPTAPLADGKDMIRELAKALLEEMQRQANGPDDQGPPVVNDPNNPNPPPGTTPPVGGTPPGVPPGVGTGGNPPGVPPGIPPGMTREQAAPLAIAALQRNCAACHTGAGSKGDTIIFSQPGVLDPNVPWRAMKREIEAGRMPPKQSQFRLTPEELSAVRIWLGGL